jgi:Spy/CpxP family protein refolding chaperone
MNMKTNLRNLISVFLGSITVSVLATPMECGPMDSCFEIVKWQDLQGQTKSHQGRNISNKQQDILLALMKSQAEDRQEIRRIARLALINLQRLAVSERYDQSAAKELALIYGHALAELTYLDIQLAVRFRSVLSEAQLKSLQDKIDLHQ